MATIQLKPSPVLTVSIATTSNDPRDMFKAASFWTRDFPKQCGHCKSKNITCGHRLAKGYDFYEAICQDCNHSFSFGQLKDGTGLFPKTQDGWKPPYGGGGQQSVNDVFPDDSNQDADSIPY